MDEQFINQLKADIQWQKNRITSLEHQVSNLRKEQAEAEAQMVDYVSRMVKQLREEIIGVIVGES